MEIGRYQDARYRSINENINRLIASLQPAKDIDPYVRLMTRFAGIDVSKDAEFQKDYRKYWVLNGAKPSQDFCDRYFALMQSLRTEPDVRVSDVALRLHAIPFNRTGRHTLQFSFATKLVHTLHPERPIYDKMVGIFFQFRPLTYRRPLKERLAHYIQFYDFIAREHARILAEGLLRPALKAFRDNFPMAAIYTDQKIIDTLIWKGG